MLFECDDFRMYVAVGGLLLYGTAYLPDAPIQLLVEYTPSPYVGVGTAKPRSLGRLQCLLPAMYRQLPIK